VRIPVPAGQVKVTPKGRRGVSVDAHYCSIILPAVPPGVAPPGAAAVLAPPANVCTLFFK
jgi:hypothetical protein